MENFREHFSSIVLGKSPILIDGTLAFAKHYGLHDGVESELVYKRELERTKKMGIDSERDRLKFLELEGLWSSEKEEEINRLRASINSAKTSKKNLLLPSHKEEINKNIKNLEAQLLELFIQRCELVGETQESFAKRESEVYFILNSVFKDPDLRELYIPKSKHEEIEDEIIDELTNAYNSQLNFLFSGGVKKVALSGEAQMLISLSENAYYFYGKPIALLTFFQSELFIYGKNYAQMLRSDVPPPDFVRDDPDKLEDWFDSVVNSKRVIKDTGNVSLVGASVEDIKQITGGEVLDIDSEIKKAAESNNGVVSMESMMKMLGQKV